MKKVINGKMYNTDTAEMIYSLPSWKDTGHDMYKKKTGEFFIYCWSKWSGHEPHIEPLTEERAKELCEVYLDGDEYEEVFGKVEE